VCCFVLSLVQRICFPVHVIQGGNPLAAITWSCDGATQITPTGSPSTVDAISSVELVTSKDNNGQICICTGRHILWTNDKTQQHTS
jgi:hypothetical protein